MKPDRTQLSIHRLCEEEPGRLTVDLLLVLHDQERVIVDVTEELHIGSSDVSWLTKLTWQGQLERRSLLDSGGRGKRGVSHEVIKRQIECNTDLQ